MHSQPLALPTKKLAAACITAGFTVAAWVVVILGIVIFESIPPMRQVVYLAICLAGTAATAVLTLSYVVARERHARALAAHWEARKARQVDLKNEEEEWRQWWAEARDIEQDTVVFGTTVVPISQRRRPSAQAG